MFVKVNCKHADEFGKCGKKKRNFIGMKQKCVEHGSLTESCDIAERTQVMKTPPSPPTPDRSEPPKGFSTTKDHLNYIELRRFFHRLKKMEIDGYFFDIDGEVWEHVLIANRSFGPIHIEHEPGRLPKIYIDSPTESCKIKPKRTNKSVTYHCIWEY